MINFCVITPTPYLHLTKDRPVHLLLAHLIEEDEDYKSFYVNLKKVNPDVVYICDNSAFEMAKAGRPMYPSDKLIDMASSVSADYVVMSDYPFELGQKTIDAAIELIPKFKKAGFKTFFCPQSKVGDLDDLVNTFEWAIDNPDVDLIGVSILACPNAYGIKQTTYDEDVNRSDEMYRLQRFLSRWQLLNELDKRRMLGKTTKKRFHLLGMFDGYKELELMGSFSDHIYSNDSSSPCWHGIHGIRYDNTPTGLARGKFEKEVDFSFPFEESRVKDIKFNMKQIDRCLEKR